MHAARLHDEVDFSWLAVAHDGYHFCWHSERTTTISALSSPAHQYGRVKQQQLGEVDDILTHCHAADCRHAWQTQQHA